MQAFLALPSPNLDYTRLKEGIEIKSFLQISADRMLISKLAAADLCWGNLTEMEESV